MVAVLATLAVFVLILGRSSLRHFSTPFWTVVVPISAGLMLLASALHIVVQRRRRNRRDFDVGSPSSDPFADIVATCRILEELLSRYGFDGHADFVREALLFDNLTERQELLSRLASGDVWGSAGSIFDIEFPLSAGLHKRVVEDRRAFRAALRRLALALLRLEMEDERLTMAVETLERWRYPRA